MPNPQKQKGDRAELGVQALIRDLLGWPARRKLGAGRLDDTGDIEGIPDTVVQVADWKGVSAALRLKPLECEVQQARAGATFGATFLRLRGGGFRVVLTPEQWSTYARESCSDDDRLAKVRALVDALQAIEAESHPKPLPDGAVAMPSFTQIGKIARVALAEWEQS